MSDFENLRVVKVGGSLLSSSGLGQRIQQWIERCGWLVVEN